MVEGPLTGARGAGRRPLGPKRGVAAGAAPREIGKKKDCKTAKSVIQ